MEKKPYNNENGRADAPIQDVPYLSQCGVLVSPHTRINGNNLTWVALNSKMGGVHTPQKRTRFSSTSFNIASITYHDENLTTNKVD